MENIKLIAADRWFGLQSLRLSDQVFGQALHNQQTEDVEDEDNHGLGRKKGRLQGVCLNNGSNIIKPWALAHGFMILEPLFKFKQYNLYKQREKMRSEPSTRRHWWKIPRRLRSTVLILKNLGGISVPNTCCQLVPFYVPYVPTCSNEMGPTFSPILVPKDSPSSIAARWRNVRCGRLEGPWRFCLGAVFGASFCREI